MCAQELALKQAFGKSSRKMERDDPAERTVSSSYGCIGLNCCCIMCTDTSTIICAAAVHNVSTCAFAVFPLETRHAGSNRFTGTLPVQWSALKTVTL